MSFNRIKLAKTDKHNVTSVGFTCKMKKFHQLASFKSFVKNF